MQPGEVSALTPVTQQEPGLQTAVLEGRVLEAWGRGWDVSGGRECFPAIHEYLISAYFGRRLVGSDGGRLEPGLSSDSGSTDSFRLVVYSEFISSFADVGGTHVGI